MSRTLIALLFLLLALGLTVPVWANDAHAPGACPAQSWDQKTGPTTLWWKALTACNDHPADEIQHSVFLQQFDWNSWTWSEEYLWAIYWTSQYDTDWVAVSRYREVEEDGGYGPGYNCYRIRTHHFVVEWDKRLMSDGNSHSWGWCY